MKAISIHTEARRLAGKGKAFCLLLASLIWGISTSLANPTDSLAYANTLYTKGEYASAAKHYEAIAAEGLVAPELYYNLGNAYYKMNETGRSILNYERALRLNENYSDARHNLELAKQKIVDNIPEKENFFLLHWIETLIRKLNSNQWLYISFSLFIGTLILAFLFLFANAYRLRKIAFYTATLALACSTASFIFAGIRKSQFEKRNTAIVMTGVVVIKSSPDKRGTDLFQLHEGCKVKVKGSLGEWSEVEIANGSAGWIESALIEKI